MQFFMSQVTEAVLYYTVSQYRIDHLLVFADWVHGATIAFCNLFVLCSDSCSN